MLSVAPLLRLSTRLPVHRLQQLSLSGPLLLSLQLDCAVLCDELGARGEVDNMATAALATSSTVSEQAGLQEMLVSGIVMLMAGYALRICCTPPKYT